MYILYILVHLYFFNHNQTGSVEGPIVVVAHQQLLMQNYISLRPYTDLSARTNDLARLSAAEELHSIFADHDCVVHFDDTDFRLQAPLVGCVGRGVIGHNRGVGGGNTFRNIYKSIYILNIVPFLFPVELRVGSLRTPQQNTYSADALRIGHPGVRQWQQSTDHSSTIIAYKCMLCFDPNLSIYVFSTQSIVRALCCS